MLILHSHALRSILTDMRTLTTRTTRFTIMSARLLTGTTPLSIQSSLRSMPLLSSNTHQFITTRHPMRHPMRRSRSRKSIQLSTKRREQPKSQRRHQLKSQRRHRLKSQRRRLVTRRRSPKLHRLSSKSMIRKKKNSFSRRIHRKKQPSRRRRLSPSK